MWQIWRIQAFGIQTSWQRPRNWLKNAASGSMQLHLTRDALKAEGRWRARLVQGYGFKGSWREINGSKTEQEMRALERRLDVRNA